MVEMTPHGSEIEEWKFLNRSFGAHIKCFYDELRKELFPNGIEDLFTFLRNWKNASREIKERYINDPRFSGFLGIHLLHEDAFDVLFEYGLSYQGYAFNEPISLEPERGGCFKNSATLMNMNRNKFPSSGNHMCYVEGVVAGVRVRPMLHAWNTFEKGAGAHLAIDWTQMSYAEWSFYLGIPFTQEEYEKIYFEVRNNKKVIVSLFGKDSYPETRDIIDDILKERKNQ